MDRSKTDNPRVYQFTCSKGFNQKQQLTQMVQLHHTSQDKSMYYSKKEIKHQHVSSYNQTTLHSVESDLQRETLKAKSVYESTFIHQLAHNSNSKIYKYIRSLTKNHGLPQNMYLNNEGTTSDQEKAEIFNMSDLYNIYCLTAIPLNGHHANSTNLDYFFQ